MAITKLSHKPFWDRVGKEARDMIKRIIFDKGKSVYGDKWLDGQYSPAYTGTETNLTAENFIGFADTASSANETSKVKIIGLDVNQSGLTAGQKLYVQNDGTLSETAVTDKVVDAGQAISSTKINIKG